MPVKLKATRKIGSRDTYRKKTIVGIAVSIAFLLIAVSIAFYRSSGANFDAAHEAMFFIFVGLSLGLVSLYVTNALTVDSAIGDFLSYVDKTDQLEYMGNTKDGIEYIISVLPSVGVVRNTAIRHFPEGAPAQQTSYMGKISLIDEPLLRQIKEDNIRWTDILSQPSYSLLKKTVEYEKTNRTQRYIRYVIPDKYVALNFIILIFERPRYHQEVLFGWGFGYGAEGGIPVYKSENPNVVRLFEFYWDMLINTTAQIDPLQDRPSMPDYSI